jgi:hypothetical protein
MHYRILPASVAKWNPRFWGTFGGSICKWITPSFARHGKHIRSYHSGCSMSTSTKGGKITHKADYSPEKCGG